VKRSTRSVAGAIFGAAILLPILANGCGDADGLATVTGTVRLDGKPIAGAAVHFTVQGQPPSHGTTDKYGRYDLYRTRSVRGAAIGTNRVGVSISPGPRNQPLPENFSLAASELVFEVKRGKNHIDLDLRSN
jgi:hypothetical protein